MKACITAILFGKYIAINICTFLQGSSLSQFSGYLVEKKARGGDWEPAFPGGRLVTKPEATITGLPEGRVYEFRVAAVNDGGAGAYSKATDPHKIRDPICKLFHSHWL